MLNIRHKIILKAFILLSLAAVVSIGCANRGGGPQGGPKDEVPPKVLESTPKNGAVNYTKPRVEIVFDEIVVLNNAFDKVVISPPQKQTADVKALGKRVKVAFQDSLLPNTTYTIDFSDAIVDNNEGNKLSGYSFSFSTGDAIDTLMMSGVLIDAVTLNPISNALIGIHSNLSDTAFTTKRFDRISKTNANGRFCIKNIKQGSYRVFALNDLSGDFLFDQAEEAIAFLDTVFTPTVENKIVMDTLWKDSTTIDTVTMRTSVKYFPDTIVMRFFKEKALQQYFIRAERKLPYKVSLVFNAPLDTLPQINPLNFVWSDEVLLQQSLNKDTLTYWIRDSLISSVDTLMFELHYPKTDSIGQMVNVMDTLELPVRRERKVATEATSDRRKKKNEKPPMVFLDMTVNLSASFDVYRDIQINFSEPTKLFSDTLIVLERQADTLWIPQTFVIEQQDSLGLKFNIAQKWQEGASYRFRIDSAAFVAPLSKLHTKKYSFDFRVKTKEDYATLIVNIDNYTGKEVLQLLDATENVLRTEPAEKSTVYFNYLNPGICYLRLFIDENSDGMWTTGNYKENLQPEPMYYFTKQMEMRAYWDVEETWNYLETPLLEQKPANIRKPADAKEQKN